MSVFQIQSEAVDAFMKEAWIATPMAKAVTHLDWVQNDKKIVFPSHTAVLSKAEIEKSVAQIQDERGDRLHVQKSSFRKFVSSLIARENPKFRTPVQVEIIEVSWLNDKIKEFYQYLANENRQGIYDNTLIKVLLEQQNYTSQIMALTFLPYVAYMIATLCYFIFIVPEAATHDGYFYPDAPMHLALRILIMLISLYLLGVEIGQMIVMKMDYWGDKWNYLNLSVVLVNQFIIVEHATGIFSVDPDVLINLTSLACVQLWLSFYYLLRLFPETAFYVYLIEAVLFDLRYFLLFYFMTITMFTSAMSVIDYWYETRAGLDEDLEYIPITLGQTDLTFFNQFLAEWKLGFGEFYVDNYAQNGGNPFEWVYFIGASFFTNIVFLNMLIAIMQSTFEKVLEQK